MIIVMLSHPSPTAKDGAKHRSSTLSQTSESLVFCEINKNHIMSKPLVTQISQTTLK
jgi:hypothetical protein